MIHDTRKEGSPGGPGMVVIRDLAIADARRVSGPGMRAFLAIADRWGLTTREQLNVLGKPGHSAYRRWATRALSGAELALPIDTLLRISAVLGIHQALRTIFARDDDGIRWLKSPNSGPLFGGQAPLALVTNATQDGILVVRRHLDAWRGGLFATPDPGSDDLVSPITSDDLLFL
ncbi:MbcA/ParS/Xre antitoxin family protein [Nitrospirillum bahiense]|uniref:Uncharacterized protein DUF2384 n=1 Tax=Nitrospirillum amazonense TaxID=28077 RepID=A0A560G1I1_9PROT|nr:MbcA/ParS/Xre antitoxin family protein [Nitrospirillum amazonense]TWB27692.1 uncharacterized protein DUF2384 [Nitrospirillum amazonense]